MRTFLFAIILIPLLSIQPLFAQVEDGVEIRKVQRVLTTLCYKPGPIDGLWGRRTANAVTEFFADEEKEYDGYLNKSEAEFIFTRAAVINGLGKSKKCKSAAYKKTKPSKTQKIHFFENTCCEIPDNIKWQPNDATLEYYYKKTANTRHQMFKINGSKSPKQFTKKVEKHPFIEHEMATKTILSYLYYEDGMIVYDALPPSDRFEYKFDNSSYFPSHSMGKSITSYLVGHAICQGYISSVDEPIHDWPLMENTLYYGQPLIRLLNMQAGDTNVINEFSGNFIKTGRNIHGNAPLLVAANNPMELKNTTPKANAKYAYSNLTSDIIFNYLMHRVGNDFDKFIHDFYQNKVGIEHPVYLWMNPLVRRTNASKLKDLTDQGAGQYGISATRYDFLRIAVAILEDWQKGTCEGKYLRDLYKKRVRKNSNDRYTKTYSGQFHTDVNFFKNKNSRSIFAMIGYNGQKIMIDLEKSRITVIGAVKNGHFDDWRFSHEVLIYGRLR